MQPSHVYDRNRWEVLEDMNITFQNHNNKGHWWWVDLFFVFFWLSVLGLVKDQHLLGTNSGEEERNEGGGRRPSRWCLLFQIQIGYLYIYYVIKLKRFNRTCKRVVTQKQFTPHPEPIQQKSVASVANKLLDCTQNVCFFNVLPADTRFAICQGCKGLVLICVMHLVGNHNKSTGDMLISQQEICDLNLVWAKNKQTKKHLKAFFRLKCIWKYLWKWIIHPFQLFVLCRVTRCWRRFTPGEIGQNEQKSLWCLTGSLSHSQPPAMKTKCSSSSPTSNEHWRLPQVQVLKGAHAALRPHTTTWTSLWGRRSSHEFMTS